jgi:hypothetical protein
MKMEVVGKTHFIKFSRGYVSAQFPLTSLFRAGDELLLGFSGLM